MTISFKEGSTLYHLIHVTCLKSDIIRNLDELYIHFTLKRSTTSQLLTKLEHTINVVFFYARLFAADLVKPDQVGFLPSLVRFQLPAPGEGGYRYIPGWGCAARPLIP